MARRHASQWLLTLLASGLSAALASAADGRPPYMGYVTADDVDARSGPGEEYYSTMRLGRRDRVEVYRHDPGGWFAIRPPQHSFSWVSGEFVRPGAEDVGEVIGDRVIVRVGSQLDNSRDVIQVRLNRGEQVQILGSKEFDDGAGPKVWYQIAPPPGEFRWVHGRYVSSQPLEPDAAEDDPSPETDAEPERADEDLDRDPGADERKDFDDVTGENFDDEERHVPTVRVSKRRAAEDSYDDLDEAYDDSVDNRDEVDDAEDDVSGEDPESPAARRDRARRQRLREAAEAEEEAAAAELVRQRAALRERRRRAAEAGEVDHEPDAPADQRDDTPEEGAWRNRGGRRRTTDQAAESRPALSTDERFQSEIDQLDLELSAMVAQEATEWSFTNLRARGEALLARGQTALERGRVRRVLTKLEKFADIKSRLDTAANIAADTQRRNSLVSASPSQSRGPHMRPEFDGVGRLARVQSDRAGVPAFALTDTTGVVRFYVTPSPGTNLQHYIGQEVGINGTLGFLPELNTQHVTARRVESIGGDRTTIR
ncbi:MAG: hypothetical protein K2Y37_18160 [Pirellulales bacterium]|nr:hypothetical protein [Pirellulales bacterium]